MRICLVNAHPDPSPERFCHAIADAYQAGAEAAGHMVARIDAGALDITFLSGQEEFGTPPGPDIARAQAALAAAEHFVLIYPLWMGTLPAKAKAFLEQLARAEFLIAPAALPGKWPRRLMTGRSARVIVTMGMPGFAYRTIFGAHSLKGIEAGVLRIAGFSPVRDSVFGGVDASPDRRRSILDQARRLGAEGR